ncbi:MAG: RNA 2'-phosphotransferase [Bacteroidota bacterium]
MNDLKHISKFLSLVLRHKPEEIGISMDSEGWVDVKELLEKCSAKKRYINLQLLQQIVNTNDKQRFTFNHDHTKIRANQGHTINIDLQLEQQEPPEILYHGTVEKFISAIKETGLQKMQRQHVHLSKDLETAVKVGSRRGKPVILKVHAAKMQETGHAFYLSQNGVWLCDHVPVEYIEF